MAARTRCQPLRLRCRDAGRDSDRRGRRRPRGVRHRRVRHASGACGASGCDQGVKSRALKRRLIASVLLTSAIALAPRASTVTATQGPSVARGSGPEYGPPNGTLFIGGGSTLGFPIEPINRFIERGGGVDGKFVIVPTGGGNFDPDGNVIVYSESQVIGPWLNRGLKNVKMLHTHDPKIADTPEFAKVLTDAT